MVLRVQLRVSNRFLESEVWMSESQFPFFDGTSLSREAMYLEFNRRALRRSCIALIIRDAASEPQLLRVYWGISGVSLLRQRRPGWFGEQLSMGLPHPPFTVSIELADPNATNMLLRREHVSIQMSEDCGPEQVVQVLRRMYNQ